MPKTALWFRADNLDNFAVMRFFPGLFNRSVKLKVYMCTHKKPLVLGRFLLARKPLAERVDKKLIAMDKKILLW